MDALLKSRNIKFIVAIYPDVFQINKTLLKVIFERFRLRIEDYDLDLVQNILKSFLQSKDISYIDFTDRFRSEGQEKDPLSIERFSLESLRQSIGGGYFIRGPSEAIE